MKRNMDLIRLLLTQIEGEEQIDLTGWPKEQVTYHKGLLVEAGLVHGEVMRTHDKSMIVAIIDLTWDGHEFLANVRNDSVWKKLKEITTSKGVEASFAVIKALATKLTFDLLGLS